MTNGTGPIDVAELSRDEAAAELERLAAEMATMEDRCSDTPCTPTPRVHPTADPVERAPPTGLQRAISVAEHDRNVTYFYRNHPFEFT